MGWTMFSNDDHGQINPCRLCRTPDVVLLMSETLENLSDLAIWMCVQGDRICDVCKKEIKNLPELPPRATDGDGDTTIDINMFDDADHPGHPHGLGGPFMGEVPGSADVVFDLIRVCPVFESTACCRCPTHLRHFAELYHERSGCLTFVW